MDEKLRLLRSIAKELTALHKQIHAILEQYQAENSKTNNNPVQPVSIEIPSAPDLATTVNRYYKAENEDRNSTWRKLKPWVETVGLITAIAIAGVSLWTTFEIRKQTPAVIKAGNAAESAATTAIEQFRIDERAWIEIERIERVQIGEAFRYRLYLRNVGKTAAHSIVMNAARNSQTSITLESNVDGIRRMQDTILQSSLPQEVRENPVPKVIAPGTTAAVPFVMDGQVPQIFAKDEWVSYLIGRADYTDDFGVAHWMKFCFYVGEANGNLWNCHEGNDEDRNPQVLPKK